MAVEGTCAEGLPPTARCGTVTVPEDRAGGQGRTIDLPYIVLPAKDEAARVDDPVFLLAGGPGQAGTTLVALADRNFGETNERRDLVFVDQRGTGGSNPLQCTWRSFGELAQGPWHPDSMARLEECRDGFDADLTRYATPLAMDDLDDVRAALGYETINLWGGSYGTRAGLVYLRRHEEHVRSMALWGVAPPDYAFPAGFAPYGQASFDRLMADCAADEACHALLPDGAATLDRVLTRLEADPVIVETVDPRAGALAKVELTRDMWIEGMRIVLYDAGWSAQVPAMLAAADKGDYHRGASFFVPVMGAILSQIHIGMFLSVACPVDGAALSDADEAKAEGTFVGPGFVSGVRRACAIWPTADMAEDYREPVRSDVPVLLMAGELDPVTPPATAEQAAETLSSSRVVVFPNTGHLASDPKAAACEEGLYARFFETADAKGLDASCAEGIERPAFAMPKAKG